LSTQVNAKPQGTRQQKKMSASIKNNYFFLAVSKKEKLKIEIHRENHNDER